MPKAKAAALEALALDDGLAEAHASLGRLKMAFDWDWAGAEQQFRYALDLNPYYATARQWYANCLVATGRTEEAIFEIGRACELEPFSLALNGAHGWIYYLARRYEEAIAMYRRTLEMDAHFLMAQREIAMVFEQLGRHDEALAAIRLAIDQGGENPFALTILGHVLATSGQEAEARSIIEQLHGWRQRSYVSSQAIAVIHAALGEPELAFEYLRLAAEEHSSPVMWLKVDPWVDRLRPDPRFVDLLRHIGLAGS
jgi:tetratricopeptide (TPR) repeat protein